LAAAHVADDEHASGFGTRRGARWAGGENLRIDPQRNRMHVAGAEIFRYLLPGGIADCDDRIGCPEGCAFEAAYHLVVKQCLRKALPLRVTPAGHAMQRGCHKWYRMMAERERGPTGGTDDIRTCRRRQAKHRPWKVLESVREPLDNGLCTVRAEAFCESLDIDVRAAPGTHAWQPDFHGPQFPWSGGTRSCTAGAAARFDLLCRPRAKPGLQIT